MKLVVRFSLTLLALALLAGLVYALPPVRERLEWRIAEWQARLQYALSPPGEAVFVPVGPGATQPAPAIPSATITPLRVVQEGNVTPPTADVSPLPSETPAPTNTALPTSVQLTGFRHEYQTWNNCGPATLAMALSFWGWQGDQTQTAEFLKPNPRDKNVMPYEMAAYIDLLPDLNVAVRAGGDLEKVKQLVAGGVPVILEKGFEGPDFEGWMGHYVTVTGFDDALQQFTTQDSFLGPNIQVGYEEIEKFWRAFNFTYIVIYPPDREAEVQSMLGEDWNAASAERQALETASKEIDMLSGKDRFFAWFNRGSSLVALQDYAGAGLAYDEAFAQYAALPPEERPWRMMWYQTGPYWAYYYTGRYADVIELANTTLDAMSEPVLEESYYWRGLAREALGDLEGAIEDWRSSLVHHPGFAPSMAQLERVGAEFP